MSLANGSDDGGFLAEAARLGWKNRKFFTAKLQELINWYRGDAERPGILLIGPGGVGKTTLGRMLSGEYDPLFDLPGQYDESLDIETYSLQESPEVKIVVPPGQQHRREATWKDLQSDIVAGKFRGIIQFVSYGYHTLGKISYKQHRLYNGDVSDFLTEYLKDRRNDELEVLKQLMPSLRLVANKRLSHKWVNAYKGV